MFCRRTPRALLTPELAFRWGGFGEAYCVGFLRDLVTPLGKRYRNNLRGLPESGARLPGRAEAAGAPGAARMRIVVLRDPPWLLSSVFIPLETPSSYLGQDRDDVETDALGTRDPTHLPAGVRAPSPQRGVDKAALVSKVLWAQEPRPPLPSVSPGKTEGEAARGRGRDATGSAVAQPTAERGVPS